MFSSQGLSLKSILLYYFLDFIWKDLSLYISWTLFYACHFMKRQLKVLVTPSCPTLCNPMDGSLPASSVHEILQARIMEWVTISFSRGSSWPQDQTQISCIVDGFFYHLSHLGSHLMKGQLIWPKTNFNLHLLEFAEWLLSEKPVCQNQLYPEKQPSDFGPREASPPILSEWEQPVQNITQPQEAPTPATQKRCQFLIWGNTAFPTNLG